MHGRAARERRKRATARAASNPHSSQFSLSSKSQGIMFNAPGGSTPPVRLPGGRALFCGRSRDSCEENRLK